ncbi:hypothetical protein [Inhella sp.]|jgi:hypothetical protein|uniref:hypothetical protein n=2 Tax=Inhella sp. TaxID=1921806 RepID=UPI00345B73BD
MGAMLKSRALWIALAVLVLLPALYFWAALNWSYSSGERAGWVQKLSHKGFVCKTWEGELALVSTPGAPVEKFAFTLHDDAVAADINRLMGRRVALHYEQKMGLPTSCFGETRYFVTAVKATDEVQLAPGVVVPQSTPPAPAAASATAR